MANKTSGSDRRSKDQLKKLIEDELRQGATFVQACEIAGRSVSWLKLQRNADPEWSHLLDRIIVHVRESGGRVSQVPDFPEFCEKYLGMKLWPHQLNMFDVLQGRPPRWQPDGVVYEPGTMGASRVLINLPPNHAKTMSISIGYVLWRMLADPTLTVLLISKTQGFASKILWAIKNRLTAPKYADLQLAFGPAGGFKESADRWTQTQVYLWGAERDGQDKDPSVEAVGMGGQIYGSRARLVLIDDAIVLSNAAQWENQQDWIRQEVASRIGPEDQLVVVGTRVAPVDLYRELRNPDHYADGEVPWTYLGMPAVLEYADDPKDWKTLWPKSDLPFADADVPDEEGNFPRWTGERIARVRNEVGPKRWGLVYMQHSVNEVSVFDPVCVLGSQDGRRSAGMALTPGVAGGPDAGALLSTVIGVDPAVSGYSAFCVYTFDRRSGRRWVIEVKVGRAMTPAQMRQTLEGLADTYKPIEIVIEANAFQSYMIKDQLLVQSMASRGVVIKPHYTHSRNKMDPTAGVASLAPLFGSTSMLEHQKQHNKDNLISLPAKTSTGIKVLVEELIAWDPELETRKRKQDCLMALWVAETRARDLIVGDNGRRPFQPKSGFLSERDQAKRFTVRLSDLAQAQGGGRYL